MAKVEIESSYDIFDQHGVKAAVVSSDEDGLGMVCLRFDKGPGNTITIEVAEALARCIEMKIADIRKGKQGETKAR